MNPETSRSSTAASRETPPKPDRDSLADQDIATKDIGPGPDPQNPPIAGETRSSPPQEKRRHQ